MGNIFGSSGSTPQVNSNFVATGHGVYTNDKGETIHDSFRHVNGEFTRETATSNIPPPTGFLQPQQPGQIASWMAPVAATVMLVLFIALFIYSRQTKRTVKRATAIAEDPEIAMHSIPLYSLKTRPHHASDAMRNIDLLDVEDVRA